MSAPLKAVLYLPATEPIESFISENTCAGAALLLGIPVNQVEILAGNNGSGYTIYFPASDGTDKPHNPLGESAAEALVDDFCEVSGPLLIILD